MRKPYLQITESIKLLIKLVNFVQNLFLEKRKLQSQYHAPKHFNYYSFTNTLECLSEHQFFNFHANNFIQYEIKVQNSMILN